MNCGLHLWGIKINNFFFFTSIFACFASQEFLYHLVVEIETIKCDGATSARLPSHPPLQPHTWSQARGLLRAQSWHQPSKQRSSPRVGPGFPAAWVVWRSAEAGQGGSGNCRDVPQLLGWQVTAYGQDTSSSNINENNCVFRFPTRLLLLRSVGNWAWYQHCTQLAENERSAVEQIEEICSQEGWEVCIWNRKMNWSH